MFIGDSDAGGSSALVPVAVGEVAGGSLLPLGLRGFFDGYPTCFLSALGDADGLLDVGVVDMRAVSFLFLPVVGEGVCFLAFRSEDGG